MTFEITPTADGFRIHDQIENVWTDIDAGGRVQPEPVGTGEFSVPLDTAMEFEAESLEFDLALIASVRTPDRELLGMAQEEGRFQDSRGLEIQCDSLNIVLYVRTDTGVRITVSSGHSTLCFDERTNVRIGVRSYHEHPAGVVTTSSDPRDLMRAISTFGSALKTFSPERSFPTLRGHPPEIAFRSRLEVPEALTPPDTGIRIRIPKDHASIFTVAPLAYYLGATLVPGDSPAILADGCEFGLDASTLAADVQAVLHHLFVLDCVLRTVGLYPVDLEEAAAGLSRMDLDLQALYDAPIAQRTAAYLEVPVGRFSDLLTWPQSADVPPEPRHAELLPYLTYRLAAIRSPPRSAGHRLGRSETSTGGTADARSQAGSVRIVEPELSLATHHAWVGEGVPAGGSAPILTAYVSGLDRHPSQDDISVAVLCADSGMATEIPDLYTFENYQSLTPEIHENVTTDHVRRVVEGGVDFIHFVGHVSPAGLRCKDGVLDAATLSPGRLPAFFLNGCVSYHQGVELVRKGSPGGLVSLEALDNDSAVEAGRHLSQFLSYGCTLAQSLEAISWVSPLEYALVGDGEQRLCACQDPTPVVSRIDTAIASTDSIPIAIEPIAEAGTDVGRLMTTPLQSDGDYRLESRYRLEYTAETLPAFFDAGNIPLFIDDDIYWLSDLTIGALREKIL